MRGATIFGMGEQAERDFCSAVADVRADVVASAHADGGEQQAHGVHGRQAEPGNPGFSMRCHVINSEKAAAFAATARPLRL